jgi:hypothetical protein
VRRALITSRIERYVQIVCMAGHPTGTANVGQVGYTLTILPV